MTRIANKPVAGRGQSGCTEHDPAGLLLQRARQYAADQNILAESGKNVYGNVELNPAFYRYLIGSCNGINCVFWAFDWGRITSRAQLTSFPGLSSWFLAGAFALALVKAVPDLHGASLVLEDNAPGLRAGLAFPSGSARRRCYQTQVSEGSVPGRTHDG